MNLKILNLNLIPFYFLPTHNASFGKFLRKQKGIFLKISERWGVQIKPLCQIEIIILFCSNQQLDCCNI